MIKVLLADDHALLRGSLKQLLEDTNFVQVVAQAGEYSEIMKAMGAHSVDLAILDISMPGMNGDDAAAGARYTTSRDWRRHVPLHGACEPD